MADSHYFGRYKSRSLRFPTIAKVTAVLAIFLLGLTLLISGLADAPQNRRIYSGLLQSKITPSPQVSSGEELRNLRATEDALLNSYGWVDRDSGVVHIPIDEAINRLLQKGLPTRASRDARLSF